MLKAVFALTPTCTILGLSTPATPTYLNTPVVDLTLPCLLNDYFCAAVDQSQKAEAWGCFAR